MLWLNDVSQAVPGQEWHHPEHALCLRDRLFCQGRFTYSEV